MNCIKFKPYCEHEYFDMRENCSHYNCGCGHYPPFPPAPPFPPPMPPCPFPKQNCSCNELLFLLGGIIIGKHLD